MCSRVVADALDKCVFEPSGSFGVLLRSFGSCGAMGVWIQVCTGRRVKCSAASGCTRCWLRVFSHVPIKRIPFDAQAGVTSGDQRPCERGVLSFKDCGVQAILGRGSY
jgi:hypothetical protein